MAVKKCCIEKCKSCTTRKEDKGVTYHKFPKDVTFYNEWQSITHYTNTNKDLAVYVCSRHFCKGDFLKNKDSKYILKPDAVPSIFPWTIDSVNMDTSQFEESFSSTTKDEEKNISSSSKGSEGENLDAIKKFIEEQEKEIQEKKNENENHVINTPEMASSIDEHVTQTSEKNSDIEEQEKEVNQIVSNIEDQDKENPQYKSNIEEREQELQKTDKVPESFEHHFEKVTSKTEDTANVQINVTSSVMDFILSETESKIVEKMYEENVNISPKQIMRDERNDKKNINPKENDKGNSSMSLSVGSKVEVKDFGEDWYSADIAEVDYEEMEVLVRYEIEFKKPDEWISVSSPRLRPFTGSGVKPAVAEDPDPPKEKTEPQAEKAPTVKEKSILKKLLAATAIKEEPILNIKKEDIVKTEEKAKLVFEVGERCLARWRDNRRFVATINRDLGGGQFEIMFDDGFHWTCGISRLSKMKAEKGDFLTVDTSFQSSIMGTPSPVNLGGADTSNAPISPAIPIFHTHLFDPSRDYLGSKSERREKKRKLNIKEIFNIGQKKSKIQKTEIEKAPKPVVERKPRVLKKNAPLKEPRVMLKKEIKMELPDALASIIGTMEDTNQDIKHEPVSDAEDKDEKDTPGKITEGKYLDCDQTAKYTGNTTEKFKEEVEDMDVDTMESISCIVNPNDDTLDDEDSDDPKSDGDPVLEEEVTLENFEKQDAKKHEAVIDKIKEAIIKLEDGISEIEKGQSPKVEKTYTPKLEIALSPILERVLSPNLERACIPKLESDNTLKLESDLSIDIEPSETIEDVKPEELKDILAEVAASINIEESKKSEDNATTDKTVVVKSEVPESKRDISKVKKNKRRKLSHDKTVKRQVEKVKNELEFMKKQFELMRTQMMVQSQEFGQMQDNAPLPESCLRPGEWCCRWVNGQPVGKVSEIESPLQFDADNKPVLPRRSVEVADKRLPAGWTKHMVRRSVGNSAGKWDVVLVGSEEVGNKRFHTKVDMANFLEHCQDKELKQYEDALMDFGVHLKTARRMGWIVNTPDGIAEAPETILPADTTCHLSPLVKRKSLNLKRREERRIMKPKKRGLKMKDKKRRPIKLKLQKGLHTYNSQLVEGESSSEIQNDTVDTMFEPPLMSLEDGYVYVGSLKVQIIDNLLRCPSDVCVKNFRTKTLLQMHIKHYHRELIKMMGATPKVLDLAYARTKPNEADTPQVDKKVIKVKINKPPRREEPKMSMYDLENSMDDFPTTPVKCEGPISSIPRIARSLDSPKVRQALIPKPVRRPRVLLPVRRLEPEQAIPDSMNEDDVFDDSITEPTVEIPLLEQPLDFETAISTHTVTKPLEKKKKGDKKKSFASFSKHISEDEEWFAMNSDELDTRSSFPRSGSPDSKMDGKMVPMSSESTDDQKDPNLYTYTESERIKIVHMKREEIINCHCGVREEDGLMVQCELCLCWQHALCHNIQRECEVPEKYTCSICLNPRRGRRSMRFVHDQDRLYEGLLPGAKPCETLRRSHELAGNLLRLDGALHALRHKYYVGTKKDHPKLYLWACDWEQAEISYTQEKLNSDYSDLNIMINGIDKENLPVRRDTENEDTDSVPEDDQESDRLSQRDNQLGSQALLSGLLSSPGGASLDLNITTSELERLAKSVQECGDWQRVSAPQPEAAIENEACRARLLQHIQRCQALVDTRLDSIEAQVAELESAEPSFGEHYETAEFYPRTKQTIQMLMRDLDNMEELGVIT